MVPGTPSYVFASNHELKISNPYREGRFESTLIEKAIAKSNRTMLDISGFDIDISEILGMRNLSAFVGEVFARSLAAVSEETLMSNPHQDGYPDLLLMDDVGKHHYSTLQGRLKDKTPFSPFLTGGVEVKATCGSVPSPAQLARRGYEKPEIGDQRIGLITSYDWKAHHRETNNLVGLLWDFIGGLPMIAAVFYSSELVESDWGAIVQPREGGGRTTSVSIMNRDGVRKMYAGCLAVLRDEMYVSFLNQKNQSDFLKLGGF